MPSTLGAALFYATDKKWPVVPIWPIRNGVCACGNDKCRSMGKHPITKIGVKQVAPRGVLDATTDSKVVSYWWSLIPDANIGVRGDRFFALDVDDNDALSELEDAFGKLPDTVESISGSGGRHILFRQPSSGILGNEEGDLPNGINVRGKNGYIVVSPSMHISGKRYEWELSSHPRDVEVADAPEFLIEMIGKPSAESKPCTYACSKSIPELEEIKVHGNIIDLITNSPVDGEDRSSNDQKVIVALLSAGCSPEEVKAIFSRYPIGTDGKYADRGDNYLDRSIQRGVAYVGPASDNKVESKIVPGKQVSQKEAALERLALDNQYLKGWNDALQNNTKVVSKLWPNHVGVTDGVITHYGLGIRTDYSVDETDRVFAALVVPYHSNGKVNNIGYDLYRQPIGVPSKLWELETASHIFETDLTGPGLGGQVLVTEDWDTAAHTYLNHGHVFNYLDVLGLPAAGLSEQSMQELARLLANSDRILLAWPAKRRAEGELLASLLEHGDSRVYWLTMPGSMRDMYKKFNMEAKHLNRYIQQAEPIG